MNITLLKAKIHRATITDANNLGHLWMIDNYNLIINSMCDIYNNILNTIREI